MYYKSWGNTGDGFAVMFEEVNTKVCKKEDFNDKDGSNTKSKFFKTAKTSQNDLDRYGTQLKCIADE